MFQYISPVDKARRYLNNLSMQPEDEDFISQATQNGYDENFYLPAIASKKMRQQDAELQSKYQTYKESPTTFMSQFKNEYGKEGRGVVGDTLGLIGNLFTDTGEAVEEIGKAVWSPIDTAKGIAGIFSKEGMKAVKSALKENFGTWEKAKETFYENPFDVLSVALPIAKIGTAGKLGKMAQATKVGSTIAKAVEGSKHATLIKNLADLTNWDLNLIKYGAKGIGAGIGGGKDLVTKAFSKMALNNSDAASKIVERASTGAGRQAMGKMMDMTEPQMVKKIDEAIPKIEQAVGKETFTAATESKQLGSYPAPESFVSGPISGRKLVNPTTETGEIFSDTGVTTNFKLKQKPDGTYIELAEEGGSEVPQEVFYTGRGGKIADFTKTRGDNIFFSKNKDIARYYGGTDSNVTKAYFDTDNFLDLSTKEKRKEYVAKTFTKSDIEKMFPDLKEKNNLTGETRDEFLSRHLNSLINEEAFTGGDKQKLLLDKIKTEGHLGVKLKDSMFGQQDTSYVVFDKSIIKSTKNGANKTPEAIKAEQTINEVLKEADFTDFLKDFDPVKGSQVLKKLNARMAGTGEAGGIAADTANRVKQFSKWIRDAQTKVYPLIKRARKEAREVTDLMEDFKKEISKNAKDSTMMTRIKGVLGNEITDKAVKYINQEGGLNLEDMAIALIAKQPISSIGRTGFNIAMGAGAGVLAGSGGLPIVLGAIGAGFFTSPMVLVWTLKNIGGPLKQGKNTAKEFISKLSKSTKIPEADLVKAAQKIADNPKSVDSYLNMMGEILKGLPTGSIKNSDFLEKINKSLEEQYFNQSQELQGDISEMEGAVMQGVENQQVQQDEQQYQNEYPGMEF